ncbi:hypothetical protein PIB30_063841 [Stylosanthes scabra]|uniref:F-box domain-containing protein n=1 Tax=Stylosanthes scabra TaxID=79078 RepID=A0ABU6UL31_9FABA|nr:hypothetical protein [Stylosanthes scabra]
MEQVAEDCFAQILSFASPQEACSLCVVSRMVQSMADSDTVWEKFLPLDYGEIVSRIVAPSMPCSSKKDLFVTLCTPQLIDHGNKTFWIEKRTGKICYQLSARELSIAWGNCPLYWSWKPVQGSRFKEAAELRTICWLEMNGSISTGMLSPKTLYSAYLKVKIADRAYGLDSLPSQVLVEVGHYKSHGSVYIRPSHSHSRRNGESAASSGPEKEEWLEIELGSFYTGLDKEVVKMGLKEVKGVHLKGGLIVDGIEIRPKKVEAESTNGPPFVYRRPIKA